MFLSKEQSFQRYHALSSTFTTKHKINKNSHFYLPQEHFPMNFFSGAKQRGFVYLLCGKSCIKEGLDTNSSFPRTLFLQSVLGKKGAVLGSASARAVLRIIFENILHQPH